MTALRRVPVLNAWVHDVAMDDLVNNLDHGAIMTLHVDMLVKLQRDREFRDALSDFDLITCDSQILYFALRLMGTPVQERVSGSDFFPRFYTRHRTNPAVRIFLCGGEDQVVRLAQQNINSRVGRDIVVGVSSPPHGFERDPNKVGKLVDEINRSGATVLVVCLGGGRQEKFIRRFRNQLPRVRLFLPLGGTVDYEAGTLPRPAPWVTNAGLEWAYRVLRQPRQRWHRYLVQQPPILWHLLRQRLGLYRDPFAAATEPQG